MIENSPNTPLIFIPLKMELKSGHLELRFSVYVEYIGVLDSYFIHPYIL